MDNGCKFNIGGLCKYNGWFERVALPMNLIGECCDADEECAVFEKEESKITLVKEPCMMSFPISGGDDMLDLISILNQAMYRFDHVDKTELKAVVSWFTTRWGSEV